MSNDPYEIANKVEQELRPTYELLSAFTRFARHSGTVLRSWVLQEFGVKGDATIVSQEVSVLATEHKLLPASPREQTIKRLSEIRGIKEVKASDLLDHFGSLEAIAIATTDELIEVRGISHKLARRIRSHFQPR
jgi:ERCC4-type nuclease